MNEYYIVEHPSRGVVIETIIDYHTSSQKFRCSWTAKRTSGLRYVKLEDAQKVASQIRKAYVLKVVSRPKFAITYLDGRQA